MPEPMDQLQVPATSSDAAPTTPVDQDPNGEYNKKKNKKFRRQVEACKMHRRKLIRDWQVNVDYRRGKPYTSQSDEDRIAVPLDWSFTNHKISALFSQVPAVRVNHPPQSTSDEAASWLHSYEQRINDTVIEAGIEAAMEEVLPDCINAAGIGVVIVSREAITEDVEVPAIDLTTFPPEMQAFILQNDVMPDGTEVPMTTVPRVLDSRYCIARVSPADYLWPLDYTQSDFDNAPWIGRSGRVSWAEGVRRFGLKEDEKKKIVGEDRSTTDDRLDRIAKEDDKPETEVEEIVSFDEIFYHTHQCDPDARSFSEIHHLVFVHGRERPVIDEPWKGQQFDEESQELLGAMKYPIRVLSLNYITDDPIPPSDTAVARPMVDEINKSRSQMIQQRQHSMPVRWFNVDRVDPTLQFNLMRGTWQGMIPVQGVGTNAIGEVARSSFPTENFAFDRIAKNDAAEAWQVGAGMWGQDVETKAEVEAVNVGTESRIARQRAKVGKFFIGITEVLGGLISIFEDPSSFGEGFSPLVSKTLAYSILADSTVLLDSNQRLKKLIQFINFTAKSGYVDVEPVLREIATLSGLDPMLVIRKPEPKPPVEPNISLRLTGTEDLLNPLVLAFLINAGQAPDLQKIEDAKRLIEGAVTPPYLTLIQQLRNPQPSPGAPNGPEGAMPPQPPPLPQLPPSDPTAPPPTLPSPPVPGVGQAHPNWAAMDRVNQRVLDRQNEQ